MSKSVNQNLRIIFLGTPEFSAIILEKMIKTGFKPITVVTAPDKPVGRKQTLTPSPLKVMAEKYKIPVLQPTKIIDSKFYILNSKPDLIVLAAYGQIIPKEILEIPKYGCLNIHPSLLPKYRGASPIQTTILNGDQESGVTIILMDEKMDHGPIIAKTRYQISNNKITTPELTKTLAELGGNLLIETLPQWIKGEINPLPQDHSQATYTRVIKKEDGKIDWRKSAEEIERMIRAYNPWPGTYTYLKLQMTNYKLQTTPKFQNSKMLKIIKARVLKTKNQREPGAVFLTEKKELAIACRQDVLVLEEVQLEGKRKMSAQEFLNGHREIIDTILS
ncbi:MAG: methionyl-tRNA formyltransferase [Patescibacteria group bacterium]|nr:methionyl-tRNA formyltransferase [Patescibacteria group bacterium]